MCGRWWEKGDESRYGRRDQAGGGGQQEWWKMSVIKCEIWSWRERKEFVKAWESRRVDVCVALLCGCLDLMETAVRTQLGTDTEDLSS